MPQQYECKKCDRRFDSEEALRQHNETKHGRKSYVARGKGWRLIIIVIVTIGVVGGAAYAAYLTGLPPHWHACLTITIDGTLNGHDTIPGDIGISPSLGGPGKDVHTHSAPEQPCSNGARRIHVEPSTKRDVKLGEFFSIWGQPFDDSHILDKTKDPNDSLVMNVNGVANTEFQNFVFKDDQGSHGETMKIEIIFDDPDVPNVP